MTGCRNRIILYHNYLINNSFYTCLLKLLGGSEEIYPWLTASCWSKTEYSGGIWTITDPHTTPYIFLNYGTHLILVTKKGKTKTFQRHPKYQFLKDFCFCKKCTKVMEPPSSVHGHGQWTIVHSTKDFHK